MYIHIHTYTPKKAPTAPTGAKYNHVRHVTSPKDMYMQMVKAT